MEQARMCKEEWELRATQSQARALPDEFLGSQHYSAKRIAGKHNTGNTESHTTTIGRQGKAGNGPHGANQIYRAPSESSHDVPSRWRGYNRIMALDRIGCRDSDRPMKEEAHGAGSSGRRNRWFQSYAFDKGGIPLNGGIRRNIGMAIGMVLLLMWQMWPGANEFGRRKCNVRGTFDGTDDIAKSGKRPPG